MERLTSTLTIRNLTHGEAIDATLLPFELRAWQFPYLDADWCWLVEHDEHGPIALIITAPVHGILFFWRVLGTNRGRKCSMHYLFAALRKILDNARVRGCVGYATFLHDDKPVEAKFARIILRLGGKIEPWRGMLAVNGMTDAGHGNH